MQGCGESLYLGLLLTLLFKSCLSFSSLSGGSYMGLECVVTFSKTQNKCQVCHLGKPKTTFPVDLTPRVTYHSLHQWKVAAVIC